MTNRLTVFAVKHPFFLKITIIIFTGVVCGGFTESFAQNSKLNVKRTEASLIAAEKLLNSIRSLKSLFVQSSTTGASTSGTLYMKRPGNLRIDYRKPDTLQIYADGTWIFYVDKELKEISQLPLAETPASFLIRDRFKFSEGLTVLKITKTPLTIEISAARRGQEETGSFTLFFSDKVDDFIGWAVTDAQGIRTTIKLISPVINKPIQKKIFDFRPPEWAFPKDEP
jgi:outer membrane lipoprotein-sorting protein